MHNIRKLLPYNLQTLEVDSECAHRIPVDDPQTKGTEIPIIS